MYHHRGVGQTRNLLHSDCIWRVVDTLNFYDTSCTCHGLLLRPCISRDMTSDDDAPCSYWYSSICHYTHRCSTRPAGRGSVRCPIICWSINLFEVPSSTNITRNQTKNPILISFANYDYCSAQWIILQDMCGLKMIKEREFMIFM